MANNLIQILRSNTTAVPVSLANGQLAYTSNGDTLYIGSPATGTPVIAIGGKMIPGVLTANAMLVANATSGINNLVTGTLTLQGNATTSGVLSANGGAGTAGYVLTSGGAAANAYWIAPTSGVAGSTTQVQFNNAGVLSGNAGFIYVPATNTVTIGNTIVVGTFTANSTLANVAAINVIGAVNTATIFAATSGNVGSNLGFNTTGLTIRANVVVSGVVNTTANTIVNGNSLSINYWNGNSTVNTYSNAFINATTFIIGNSTVNTVVNATIFLSGNSTVYTTGSATSDAWIGVNTNTVINSSAMFFGNSTVNATINSTSYTGSANNAAYLGGIAAASYLSTTGNYTFTGNNIFAGTNTVVSSNLTVSGFLFASNNALVANATQLSITANSTFAVPIVANSLTLTTALLATSGGTGVLGAAYAAGDILYAATAAPTALTRLSVAANGQVLQITNNLPAYGSLDGGSF